MPRTTTRPSKHQQTNDNNGKNKSLDSAGSISLEIEDYHVIDNTLKKHTAMNEYNEKPVQMQPPELVKAHSRSQLNSKKLYQDIQNPNRKTIHNHKLCASEKDVIFQQLTKKILDLASQNKMYQAKQTQLEKIINQTRQRFSRESNQQNQNIKELELILEQTEILQKQMKNIEKINEGLKKQLQDSAAKQKMAMNALNDSEQINYTLRLKIQELMKRPEINFSVEQVRAEKDKQISQLMHQISKTQVMKKQYLRAYSRIKEDKQEFQLRIIELEEQLQKFRGAGIKRELNTIIQFSDEQLRQSLNRVSNISHSYPTQYVKGLLLKALDGSNQRETANYIKCALNYLSSHQVETQVIQEVQSLQKTLLLQIEKAAVRQRSKFQKQFEGLICKLSSQRKKNSSEPQTVDYNKGETLIQAIQAYQGHSKIEDIYRIVYETLCMLPLGTCQDALFSPQNIDQLYISVNVLHKFAGDYEKINQEKEKTYKETVDALLTILRTVLSKTSTIKQQDVFEITKSQYFPLLKDYISEKLQVISREPSRINVKKNANVVRKQSNQKAEKPISSAAEQKDGKVQQSDKKEVKLDAIGQPIKNQTTKQLIKKQVIEQPMKKQAIEQPMKKQAKLAVTQQPVFRTPIRKKFASHSVQTPPALSQACKIQPNTSSELEEEVRLLRRRMGL